MITDKLSWRDRAIGVIIIVLAALLMTSCVPRPEPEPLPAPLLTAVALAVAAPEYAVWLPVVALPEPVQGYARAYSSITPAQAKALRIGWFYTYVLTPSQLGNAQFVPMFWCDQYPSLAHPPLIDYFEAFQQYYSSSYSGYMLFLNEPDLAGSDVDGGQCDRSPRQAAYIYAALLDACPNCIFIGPAASHIDYLRGWPWLREWYREIDRLDLRYPDIAAIHDYTSLHPSLVVDSLFSMLSEFPGSPRRAWVTEYGTCDPARLAQAKDYFTADPRIERYAWFTAMGYPNQPCLNLLSTTGDLTPVGEVYANGSVAQTSYP